LTGQPFVSRHHSANFDSLSRETWPAFVIGSHLAKNSAKSDMISHAENLSTQNLFFMNLSQKNGGITVALVKKLGNGGLPKLK